MLKKNANGERLVKYATQVIGERTIKKGQAVAVGEEESKRLAEELKEVEANLPDYTKDAKLIAKDLQEKAKETAKRSIKDNLIKDQLSALKAK